MFYGSQYRVHKMRRPKSCEKKVVQVDEGDGAVLRGGGVEVTVASRQTTREG